MLSDNRTQKNRAVTDPEVLKKIREMTGEGMMDCRKALSWANGDLEKAVERLLDPARLSTCLVTRVRNPTSYDKGRDLLKQIWFNFSSEDKEWFRKEDPVAMHSGLGRHLRNHCGMWAVPWTPEVREGVDYSPEHPDAISGRVIRDFQKVVIEIHEASQGRAANGH